MSPQRLGDRSASGGAGMHSGMSRKAQSLVSSTSPMQCADG
jgi:hypothetical protein